MINNNFSTKTELVLEVLKTRIINGEIEPGAELKINKISKELNISATPVREALKTLESEGIIEISAHKSAKVSEFDVDKLHQIITIRAGLEGYAARLAVDHVTELQISELEKIIEKMDYSMHNNDTETFNLNNLYFHRMLYQIAPYPMLYEMIIKVWDGGKWTKSVFDISPNRMKRSIKEHNAILDAIRNKDEDKVERLVRQHRLNAGQELEDGAKILN